MKRHTSVTSYLKMMLPAFLIVCACFWTDTSKADPAAHKLQGNQAVILAYHRIGDDRHPDTNLRLDQFQAHIKEIVDGGYTVLPLSQVIWSLKKGQTLPPRALVITFEGSYRSTYENAIPLLQQHELPFTIFYASDQLDSGLGPFMNWEDLLDLAAEPAVEVGILPSAYTRIDLQNENALKQSLNKAKIKYRENLKTEPKFFSYPFGEYSLTFKKTIQDYEFEAAMTLNSGVAHEASDMLALPRFSMTESYGDIDRFRMIANALALPVSDFTPADPYLKTDTPAIGFSLPESLNDQKNKLSCFFSGGIKPQIQNVGQSRIEIRLEEPLSAGRNRVNCTMPGPEAPAGEQQQWRWFGRLFVLDPEQNQASAAPDTKTKP